MFKNTSHVIVYSDIKRVLGHFRVDQIIHQDVVNWNEKCVVGAQGRNWTDDILAKWTGCGRKDPDARISILREIKLVHIDPKMRQPRGKNNFFWKTHGVSRDGRP
ncbi:hypothetical protein J6590_082384 [Homalodisca vitripennis]|nr:hypothetical protein J6590_082384 [Homalodisca vitripennis]